MRLGNAVQTAVQLVSACVVIVAASARLDRLRGKAALAAVIACMAIPAAAQSTRPADQWQFEIVPYLWATAMKGGVEVGRMPRVDVDASLSDVLDVLDFVAMSAFEARKGRFGILVDVIYMKVSQGGEVSRTGPGPIGATATASADLELEQTMLAAALAYRVSSGPTAIDLIGGARYNKIDAKANIAGSFFAVSSSQSRSGDKDWVDPYVGIRVLHPLNERWTLAGYLDYGGFGVGSDSTWQAIAGAEYAFSKAVSLKFGYREMDVDYDTNGSAYDMRIKAPIWEWVSSSSADEVFFAKLADMLAQAVPQPASKELTNLSCLINSMQGQAR